MQPVAGAEAVLAGIVIRDGASRDGRAQDAAGERKDGGAFSRLFASERSTKAEAAGCGATTVRQITARADVASMVERLSAAGDVPVLPGTPDAPCREDEAVDDAAQGSSVDQSDRLSPELTFALQPVVILTSDPSAPGERSGQESLGGRDTLEGHPREWHPEQPSNARNGETDPVAVDRPSDLSEASPGDAAGPVRFGYGTALSESAVPADAGEHEHIARSFSDRSSFLPAGPVPASEIAGAGSGAPAAAVGGPVKQLVPPTARQPDHLSAAGTDQPEVIHRDAASSLPRPDSGGMTAADAPGLELPATSHPYAQSMTADMREARLLSAPSEVSAGGTGTGRRAPPDEIESADGRLSQPSASEPKRVSSVATNSTLPESKLAQRAQAAAAAVGPVADISPADRGRYVSLERSDMGTTLAPPHAPPIPTTSVAPRDASALLPIDPRPLEPVAAALIEEDPTPGRAGPQTGSVAPSRESSSTLATPAPALSALAAAPPTFFNMADSQYIAPFLDGAEPAQPSGGDIALSARQSFDASDSTVAAQQRVEGGQRVAQQVAVAIVGASNDRIELVLDPAELGRVRLSLAPEGQSVAVSLVADRAETMDLLRRHIDQLARDLRDAGYSDVTFSFGPHTGDGGGRHAAPSLPGLSGSEHVNVTGPSDPAATVARPFSDQTAGLDLRM